MDYIRNTTDIQISQPTVLSLGKFDGLHMGHRRLVEQMQKKKQEGLKAVMFTFDTPPQAMVSGADAKVLTTNEEKIQVFAQTGVDYLIEYPFTSAVRSMEPEDFTLMLVKSLSVKCMVAGYDFRFGHNRKGDYKVLQACGKKYGFEVIIMDKIKYQHREVSSTFIREEISRGNMEMANMLLGYEYFIKGMVIHGRKLGRTLQIPTVNMLPRPEKLLPPNGVYVSKVVVDNKCYGGISNIGKKPTIEGINPVGVETHIFDFSEDVYGKEIEVQLLGFLRREMRFPSVAGLKEQMEKDIAKGKVYLQEYKRMQL